MAHKAWQVWSEGDGTQEDRLYIASYSDKGQAERRIARLQASQRRSGHKPYRYFLKHKPVGARHLHDKRGHRRDRLEDRASAAKSRGRSGERHLSRMPAQKALGGYYTVVIPWVASNRSAWHPTERTGPFSTLTSGAFKTRAAAVTWAKAHLRGHPFTVRHFHLDERAATSRARYKTSSRVGAGRSGERASKAGRTGERRAARGRRR